MSSIDRRRKNSQVAALDPLVEELITEMRIACAGSAEYADLFDGLRTGKIKRHDLADAVRFLRDCNRGAGEAADD